MVQLSHLYMTTGKTNAWTRRTFVSKVMSLFFNTLSRFVMAFLSRTKHLLILWLQSPSAVILEPKKIKSATLSTFPPSICHEVMGLDAMILVFWMLSFMPAVSLSSFTFIKRLVSSSSLSLDPSKLLVSYRIILLPSNHLCSAYSPHSSIPSNLWAFYCLHSFAFFLQCQMVGIIKYIAFPDWLLLLSNMYLSSMSFHGLIAHFFLTLSNIPFPGYTTVYIFTALCAFSFANYK